MLLAVLMQLMNIKQSLKVIMALAKVCYVGDFNVFKEASDFPS
jgi:hypothetical protein